MKPYGRLKNVKGLPFKRDFTYNNKEMNWWEDIISLCSRTEIKRRWKKEVIVEIKEFYETDKR